MPVQRRFAPILVIAMTELSDRDGETGDRHGRNTQLGKLISTKGIVTPQHVLKQRLQKLVHFEPQKARVALFAHFDDLHGESKRTWQLLLDLARQTSPHLPALLHSVGREWAIRRQTFLTWV